MWVETENKRWPYNNYFFKKHAKLADEKQVLDGGSHSR